MASKNDQKCLICSTVFNLNGSFSQVIIDRLLTTMLSNSSCSQILKIFIKHLIAPPPLLPGHAADPDYSECWPFCNQCSPLVMDLRDYQVQIDELQDKVGLIVRQIKSIIVSKAGDHDWADGGSSWIDKLRDDLYREAEDWCQDLVKVEFVDNQLDQNQDSFEDNYQNSTPVNSTPVISSTETGKKDRKSAKVKGKSKGLKKNDQVEDEVEDQDQDEVNKMKNRSNIISKLGLRDRSSLKRKSFEPYYENDNDDDNIKIEENSESDGEAFDDNADDFMNDNDEYDSESESQELIIKERPSRSIEQNSQRESLESDESESDVEPEPNEVEIPEAYLTVKVIRKGRFVKCSKCDFKIEATKFSKFESHVRTKHEKCELPCTTCGKVLLSWRSLRRHTQRFHSETPPSFLCSHCGKSLSSSVSLRSHAALVHGETDKFSEKFEKCSICEKPFRVKKDLEPHLLTHMNEEEKALAGITGFMCSLCGKVLPAAASLKQHEKVHQNIKPHICQICGVGFRMKQNFIDHLDTHKTGEEKEKAYYILCDFPKCDKRFRKPHHLNVHKLSHEKNPPRPYKCTELNCEKRFARQNALTVHLKRHTNIKNHTCSHLGCSKSFFTNSHLKRHFNQVHLHSHK